jgi:hypothetical protein
MRDTDSEPRDDVRLSITALLGVGVISVVQLLGATTLDDSLRFSLYCFAVAIPFLSAYLQVLSFDPRRKHFPGRWYVATFSALGPLVSLMGLGGIFWHFSRRIGLLFIAACLVAMFIWCGYEYSVKRNQ